MRKAALRILLAGMVVGLVAGCSSSGRPTTVVTITRTRSAPHPAGGSPSGTPTTSIPAPSVPAHLTKLPGTCDTLLPDYDVINALGGAPLAGVDGFVVGVPEKDIGRLAYLNCRYGVTGTGAAATAKIEIGVSLYATAAQAQARIAATTADYSHHGATSSTVPVGGHSGTLLSGATGAGYTEPLLVVASGQLTVAVDLAPTVATGAKATADATKLAQLALQRAGG